ncbi:MAG: hypothetical protein M1478_05300 [Deltaproteobacteria bacterium]|jgi:hypothetical protein|nr:hypothetical protein [Deltaproteobacteria bacterium]MCL5880232.1 hypothetical protein [Deltaproteobacteria bacterium]
MNTIYKIFYSKKVHLIILPLLLIGSFILTGCATAPVFSDVTIPQKNISKDKFKIAIKKQDIIFTSGFFTGTPLTKKSVAIYNCIGLEIYKNFHDAAILIVNKKPLNSNIIYIHDFRKAITWAVVNPVGILIPISALVISEPMKATFKASVLINGKNYTVKAYGSRTQRLMSFSPDKILRKTCGNFTEKLTTLLIVKKLPRAVSQPHTSPQAILRKN